MNCSGTTFWAYFASRSAFQSSACLMPAAYGGHYLCTSAKPPRTLPFATFTTGSSSLLVPSSARRLWQLSMCRSVSPTCSRVGTEPQRERWLSASWRRSPVSKQRHCTSLSHFPELGALLTVFAQERPDFSVVSC